jgi:hypothetical protein
VATVAAMGMGGGNTAPRANGESRRTNEGERSLGFHGGEPHYLIGKISRQWS